MRKKVLATFLIMTTVFSAGVLAVRSVKADETATFSPLVEKLIEKFNLNKDEVNNVVNEVKSERQQQMLKFQEERLNQAVADGVITNSQKQALLDKFTQRQNKRQQEREEIQNWFKTQGIDQTKLAPYLGFGHYGKFGGKGMWMMK